MNDKRTATLEDEPKYRQKSTAKGRRRSDHKHQYDVVLLTRYYRYNDFETGKPVVKESRRPCRVCTICGRIGGIILHDKKYYTRTPIEDLIVKSYSETLNEHALSLPKWYTEDCLGKFAKPEEGK